MIATVTNHPAFQKRLDLDAKIALKRAELYDAERLASDLETGAKDWSWWFDGPGFFGAQEQAALEAWLFAGDLKKELAALEAQAEGLALGGAR